MSEDIAGPVHYSRLRHIGRSPLHYYQAVTGPHEDTLGMRMGRLIHSLVLGGPFVVYEGTRRGKAWDEFATAHDGEEIVTVSEFDAAVPVAEAVTAHADAQRLLAGQRELALEWVAAGRKAAGRLDCLGSSFVTDLKSTTNSEPGWFGRHAVKMGYHAQLAWYMDGVEAAGLPAPQDAFIVAVEAKAPYAVVCYQLTPRALDMGRRTYRLWLERLAVCEQSNFWPGYVQSVTPLDVPEDETLWINGEEI